MTIAGTFFPGKSSRAVPAQASLADKKTLVITDEAGTILAQIPFRKVRVSARLGKLLRRLELPDGSRFETSDNDGIDAMFRVTWRLSGGALVNQLESSLKWVAVAVVIAALSTVLLIFYGFPAIATQLAWETPHPILVVMSNQSLATLDQLALRPSTLNANDKRRAQALFARISAAGASGKSGYHLVFRNGGSVGPNAFSLPDGTVIMTDQLYRLVQRDDELEGVFGHEIAHVDRRHALQLVYEGSLFPVAIALMTGDASQFGQIATVLPLMLIQSHYSRGFEQQADDDSAIMMRRIGGDPAALGELLQRLDKALCGKNGCSPGWLSSHPATAERASRLRQNAKSLPAKSQ